MRLDAAIDAFLAHLAVERGLAAATVEAYGRDLALLARSLGEDAGVAALVSLVSPYRADRAAAREAHDARGLRFLEVWVSTPLEECERRDTKGLYAKARAGEIPDFTGVGQPYEAPESPDLEVAFGEPLEAAAERVLAALRS